MNSQRIPIEQASAGMALATDLRDAGGVVLVAQGSVLSEGMLQALRRRGIASLDVAGEETPHDPAVDAAERERRLARLALLFRGSAELGATPQLLAYLIRYREGG